jgi:hypothetical protein
LFGLQSLMLAASLGPTLLKSYVFSDPCIGRRVLRTGFPQFDTRTDLVSDPGASLMSIANQMRRSPKHRSGLSFTELVGSLVALAGGTLIGLMYLGVDLQKAGQQLLGQVEAPTTVTSEPSTHVADSQPTESNADKPEAVGSTRNPTVEEEQQASRDYWRAITQCLAEEARGRYQQVTGGGTQQRQDYLTLRTQGHLAAVDAITQLDPAGVDPRLVEHGQQLAIWHQSAAELFEQAGELLATDTQSGGQNPLSEDWRKASIQLGKEQQLLMNRHQAMANYLNHQYPESAPFTPAQAR